VALSEVEHGDPKAAEQLPPLTQFSALLNTSVGLLHFAPKSLVLNRPVRTLQARKVRCVDTKPQETPKISRFRIQTIRRKHAQRGAFQAVNRWTPGSDPPIGGPKKSLQSAQCNRILAIALSRTRARGYETPANLGKQLDFVSTEA